MAKVVNIVGKILEASCASLFVIFSCRYRRSASVLTSVLEGSRGLCRLLDIDLCVVCVYRRLGEIFNEGALTCIGVGRPVDQNQRRRVCPRVREWASLNINRHD